MMLYVALALIDALILGTLYLLALRDTPVHE